MVFATVKGTQHTLRVPGNARQHAVFDDERAWGDEAEKSGGGIFCVYFVTEF